MYGSALIAPVGDQSGVLLRRASELGGRNTLESDAGFCTIGLRKRVSARSFNS